MNEAAPRGIESGPTPTPCDADNDGYASSNGACGGLDCDDNAIYRIRGTVRDLHTDAITRGDFTLVKQLDPHLTYLENNGHLMRYSRLHKVGLPVGSGVTEGACRIRHYRALGRLRDRLRAHPAFAKYQEGQHAE